MSGDFMPPSDGRRTRPVRSEQALTGRAARVQRRRDHRLQWRAVIRAVATDVHGPDARRCLYAGCERDGIVVVVGLVRLSFCEEHKRAFDDRYDRARRSAVGTALPDVG